MRKIASKKRYNLIHKSASNVQDSPEPQLVEEDLLENDAKVESWASALGEKLKSCPVPPDIECFKETVESHDPIGLDRISEDQRQMIRGAAWTSLNEVENFPLDKLMQAAEYILLVAEDANNL